MKGQTVGQTTVQPTGQMTRKSILVRAKGLEPPLLSEPDPKAVIGFSVVLLNGRDAAPLLAGMLFTSPTPIGHFHVAGSSRGTNRGTTDLNRR